MGLIGAILPAKDYYTGGLLGIACIFLSSETLSRHLFPFSRIICISVFIYKIIKTAFIRTIIVSYFGTERIFE